MKNFGTLLVTVSVLSLSIGCQFMGSSPKATVDSTATEDSQFSSTSPVESATRGSASDSIPEVWLQLFQWDSNEIPGQEVVSVAGRQIPLKEFELAQREYEEDQIDGFVTGMDFQKDLETTLLLLDWIKRKDLLSNVEFRAKARYAVRKALANAVVEKELASLNVSDSDVFDLYQSRLDSYTSPEQVDVRMILVPAEDEADVVMESLVSGEDFGTLARQYSRHASASVFGKLEPFARGTFNREFEDLAFSMNPGETDSVTTAAGIFIVQKVATIPASITPLESVAESLRLELLNRYKEERFIALLKELESQFYDGDAAQ